MDKKFIIGFVIAIIVLLGGIVLLASRTQEVSADQTALAMCLKDKGAIFYGAWWCPHCANTKKLFGAGKNALPYVECSTVDGNGTLPICIEKGIKNYPTWIFADGSQETGELTLEHLAEKAGCPAPVPQS